MVSVCPVGSRQLGPEPPPSGTDLGKVPLIVVFSPLPAPQKAKQQSTGSRARLGLSPSSVHNGHVMPGQSLDLSEPVSPWVNGMRGGRPLAEGSLGVRLGGWGHREGKTVITMWPSVYLQRGEKRTLETQTHYRHEVRNPYVCSLLLQLGGPS